MSKGFTQEEAHKEAHRLSGLNDIELIARLIELDKDDFGLELSEQQRFELRVLAQFEGAIRFIRLSFKKNRAIRKFVNNVIEEEDNGDGIPATVQETE